MLCATLRLSCANRGSVSCIGSCSPAIFLHGGGEKRRIVIRRIEADELGFELPLQYLDQLASKSLYENDENVRTNRRTGFLAGVAD
jgi:hypothetical protein